MKKILSTTLILSALLLAGCSLPKLNPPANTSEVIPATDTTTPETPASTPTATVEGEVTIPGDTPRAIAEGGIFLPYTPTAVAQAKGNVVLFFSASWCPTCQAFKKDIKAHLAEIPKDLTLLEVNFDDALDLRKSYGVTLQHTFVQVDNNGKMIKKWSGGTTLKDIVSEIQN